MIAGTDSGIGATETENRHPSDTQALEGAFTTKLTLPLDISFEDWTGRFFWSALMSARINFYLAIVLNHPHAESHEAQQIIADVQKDPRFVHLTDGTLANIKSIGRRYSANEWDLDVSWSHHAAVAYIEDHVARAQLLIEAKEKGLKVKELRERVSNDKDNHRGMAGAEHSMGDGGVSGTTLEDFNDARERCLRHVKDFLVLLKDREVNAYHLLVGAQPLIDSLNDLKTIGEQLK